MNVSSRGIDLIRRWEGLRLEAYICPAGVPSIGYGSIVHADGRPVRLGDRISEEQAEALLMQECASFCPQINRLVTVPLNQNQFDALVSFTYNLGAGALGESTLLKKLNRSDPAGAAAEFERWNKAVVNGRRTVLEGLTRRRREERQLFESPKPGGPPLLIDATPTPQLEVTWLEAYADGEDTVIVGWNDDRVVEVVRLESRAKKLLVQVLDQYPRAGTLAMAPAGKPIPAGPRIAIEPTTRIPPSGSPPPPAPESLLLRGCRGEDVARLQERLADLGYYAGAVHGEFDAGTDIAARGFQADQFGPAEADGKVGPLTWARLWGPEPGSRPAEPAARNAGSAANVAWAGKTFLQLTRTDRRDGYGLFILQLRYIRDGIAVDHLQVCSGGPSHQRFRTGEQSRSGSFEPLPEGLWRIEDIAWRDGRDNYNGAIWASGLGPVSTPIEYLGPGTTRRGNIEIHLDFNRSSAPGTAGCIGISTVSDYRRLVNWLRERDPRQLYVDWGLGTCPGP